MKMFVGAALALLSSIGCDSQSLDQPSERDNTAVNQRDSNDGSITAEDQSNTSAEIEKVAAIRNAVVNLDGISTNGQNVKIITGNGTVVLRGPVKSQAERDAIEQTALKFAGSAKVVNELEIESE